LAHGERCYNSGTQKESFEVFFYDGTLKPDSIQKGGWVKQLLVGETMLDKKWCLYIWKSARFGKTRVTLTEDQGSSPYCDGSTEVLVNNVVTNHTNQSSYTYTDSDMTYEYNAGSGYIRVHYKDTLVGTLMALVFVQNYLGQPDAASAYGYDIANLAVNSPEQYDTPEFTTEGIAAAGIIILFVMLLLREKEQNRAYKK